MESTYDDTGRRIHERATTIVTGFDDAVRRISTAYDDHGHVSAVSSYDRATLGSGSVLDEVAMQYDDWGNLAIFQTDPDSAIGASGVGPYQVEHEFAKSAPAGGRHTLRRAYGFYPGDASVEYSYLSTSGQHDGNLSRVTQLDYQIGLNPRVTVAKYAYLGVGDLVGTELPEPGMHSRQHGSTKGSYPDRDVFNRTARTRWSKTSPGLDFVDLAIAYDPNSNITSITDAVLGAGFDVLYAVDALNRLVDADEGEIDAGSITNRTRRQQWTLDQVGNWANVQLDLNGDGLLTGTGELDETRTHNLANEILTREPDSSPPPEFTFAHDPSGNMTDDGEEYAYEYDAWYRLVRIRNRSTTDLVAEYTYYGNGYRASSHHDTNLDGDVDGDDPVYFFAYDERWRIVATFRDDDTDPKERFLHHAAGLNGYGGSSYIDSIILRDRDADTDWDVESDGVLEERRYYCQSWRHDVVAIVTDDGKLAERARYSAYGVPYGIALGDIDGDGTVDGDDLGAVYNNWGAGPVSHDLNLDGTVDASDAAIVTANWGTTLGRGALSAIGNRRGYAGYETDMAIDVIMHVRHRVYHAELGRWTRRDPLGYVDGDSLYMHVRSNPSNPWPDPVAQAGGAEDVGELRCRGIRRLPFPQHCYIRCCKAGESSCKTFSLIEDDGMACFFEDHRRDKDVGGTPAGPAYQRFTGAGLCDCFVAGMKSITNDGTDKCPYDYNPFNCNSNWFANSMWACCTGKKAGAPIWAPFGMPWNCCPRNCAGQVIPCRFKCGPGNPGSGYGFCCGAAN